MTPDILPDDTWSGRLWLLGLGMLITAITQSSSAGVAAALVLLSTGSISFTQAAAMVIGMNIGTTVTALMATLGGSAAMLHQLDHLNRLRNRADQMTRINTILKDPLLQRPARILASLLGLGTRYGCNRDLEASCGRLERMIASRARRYRRQTLLVGARKPVLPGSLFARTDAMRWLQRATHHVERAIHYGNVAAQEISRPPDKENPTPAGG